MHQGFPALKRRAIIKRPCGTSLHGLRCPDRSLEDNLPFLRTKLADTISKRRREFDVPPTDRRSIYHETPVGIPIDLMYVKVVKACHPHAILAIAKLKALLVFPLAVFFISSAQGQVVINEIMSDNVTAVDNEATFPDWIELYNAGPAAVDMSGWGLTDSVSQPFKFVFPSGSMIEPGAFLVLWCDDLTNAPGFHTGFTLRSKEGDDVTLFDSNLLVQDGIVFGIQVPDHSIGRIPDGTGTWQLNSPTPATSNVPFAVSLVVTNLRINEIMARPSSGDDWFELYNPDTNIIHIGGLVWADTGTNITIRNLSFILPGEFIQFIADDDPE